MAYASDRGATFDRALRDRRPGFTPWARSSTTRAEHASYAVRRALSGCPEIDCIRHRLSPAIIAAAEARAHALGIGADEVLIASGHLSEEVYYQALAFSLGCAFVDLDHVPREVCPLSDQGVLLAARVGPLPLLGGRLWAIAPTGIGVRNLLTQFRARTELPDRLLFTAPAHIKRFVQRHAGSAIADQAVDGLRSAFPELSSATPPWRARAVVALAAAFLGAALWLAPSVTTGILLIAISTLFLAWSSLRLCGAMWRSRQALPELRLSDDRLPTYSVVVALYREANVLSDLLAALGSLQYPAEKLQIILVLEEDDTATRMKAERLCAAAPFEIVLVPRRAPRTKPKALNAALPFVRGDYVAVYDAEDRPEPDQLQQALAAFLANDRRVACVQARLTIDNTDDGWLSALFTAEYAGLFDALLPGLARLHLPIPLGGSSNHFRTEILRKVAAWDPYNVTEDADLGIRLARFGYRTLVIASTTYEEAPDDVGPWLKQRTRWFKGWMQTWCVHTRRPFRLTRQLGFTGFAAFQLTLIGTVFAALLQPLAATLLMLWALGSWPFQEPATFGIPHLEAYHAAALIVGYATSVVLAFVGLARRKLLYLAWVLLLMPVHWALLSVAAWRALFQFLFDRYRWEKTEHGLARSSRRNPAYRPRA